MLDSDVCVRLSVGAGKSRLIECEAGMIHIIVNKTCLMTATKLDQSGRGTEDNGRPEAHPRAFTHAFFTKNQTNNRSEGRQNITLKYSPGPQWHPMKSW